MNVYGCLSFTAVLLSLLATLLHDSTESHNVFIQHKFAKRDSHNRNARILFLTAHPDDECMFFAPTIMALTSRMKPGLSHTGHSVEYQYPGVYSLCLSVGDAGGLGTIRREELGRSLDVLGIRSDNREVVDHPYVSDSTVPLARATIYD